MYRKTYKKKHKERQTGNWLKHFTLGDIGNLLTLILNPKLLVSSRLNVEKKHLKKHFCRQKMSTALDVFVM